MYAAPLRTHRAIALCAISASLTACYVSEVEELLGRIEPPTVSAGEDQTVNPSDLVTLNGIVTGAETLEWTQTGTTGFPVELSDRSIARPTFSAPATQDPLTFRLCAVFKRRESCDVTRVNVRTNQLPIPRAGDDQIVRPSATVRLDGGASQDPDVDGRVTTYRWQQIGGSAMVALTTTGSIATFTAPALSDTLVFALGVEDDRGGISTLTDTTTVAVNAAPVVRFTYPTEGALLGRRAGQLPVRVTGTATDIDGDAIEVTVRAGDGVPSTDTTLDEGDRWAVNLEIPEGRSITLSVEAQDKKGSVNQGPPTTAQRIVNNEVLIVVPQGLTVDASDGTAYYLNREQDLVVRVDPALTPIRGARTIASAPGSTTDTQFSDNLKTAVLDEARDCMLVLESSGSTGKLIGIDLSSAGAGARTIVATQVDFPDDLTPPATPGLVAVGDMVLDTTNGANGPRLLMTRSAFPTPGSGIVVGMDLNPQGGCSYQPSAPTTVFDAGADPTNLVNPQLVALSSAGILYVYDRRGGALSPRVVEITLSSGARRGLDGDGLPAVSAGGLAFDPFQNRLLMFDGAQGNLLQISALDGTVSTSMVAGATNQPWSTPSDVVLGPNNQIYILDSRAVFVLDPVNQDATVVHSESFRGTGPVIRNPTGIAVNLDGTPPRIYVIESSIPAIIEIDPITGNRSALEDPTNTPALDAPRDLVLSADGATAYYVEPNQRLLVGIDLRDGPGRGNRTTISGPLTGTGDGFRRPRAITPLSSDQVLVLDNATPSAVFIVDVNDGQRTLVSGETGEMTSQGAGTAFRLPVDMTLDPRTGNLLVLEQAITQVTTGWLFSVSRDAATLGDRTLFSGVLSDGVTTAGGGAASFDINQASGVEFVANPALQTNDLLVFNANGDLLRVNDGGVRSSLTSAGLSGPPFLSPSAVTVDPVRLHAYTAVQDYQGVFLVELEAGQRVIVSR